MRRFKEKIIYVSGLIDGEGCISITKTKPQKGTGQISPKYEANLTVASTNEEVINWLIENFGGHFHYKKVYSIRHKPSFTWELSSRKLYPFLKNIYPYLIIKKKQAKLVLEYLKNKQTSFKVSCNRMSKEELSFRENYYLKNKKLNHRGISKSVETIRSSSQVDGDIVRAATISKIAELGRNVPTTQLRFDLN